MELSNGMRRDWKYTRKSLDCLEKTVGSNTDVKGVSGKVSDRREEHAYEGKVSLVTQWQRTWLSCVLTFYRK